MITDEKLIELLMKIKEYCTYDNSPYKCNRIDCPFNFTDEFLNLKINECQISEIGRVISRVPRGWNMEEIERIIRL